MSYTADSIDVLKGLDPVKRRPGMYTETDRPNHLAQEVIDNSVDEAIAGHANRIKITLHKENKLEVEDNGRGMPVDFHEGEQMSGVEMIMTILHAGGKFTNDNYENSGGLHGVGISVVNALSKRVDVWVKRDGKEHHIAFSDGAVVEPLKVTREVQGKGTRVSFEPDAKYFDSGKFLVSKLTKLLKTKAVLCPGLRVIFDNKVDDTQQEWCFKDGQGEYFKAQLNEYELMPNDEILFFKEKGETFQADICFAWTPENTPVIAESYVNLIPTASGGTHVKALENGLLDAFREFCDHRNMLERNIKISAEDVMTGLNFLISFKLSDPEFAGQTKERLNSRGFSAEARNVFKDRMYEFLSQHIEEGEALAEMVITNARGRMRKGKKVERKKTTSTLKLPGKLSDCQSNDLEETEVFFVEGDSAGGSAKQARNRKFQAIMPMRGKILNTWEVSPDELFGSKEIADISEAIGVEANSSDLSNLRYGKICILADADSDGLHIGTLFCALMYRHYYDLVRAGHIYVSMPPLYRIDVGKNVYYALDNEEREQILTQIKRDKIRGNVGIQRFKGLGEMNPKQLRETVMNPETRRLVQLTTDDIDFETGLIDMLLAKKKSDQRKAWLEEKGALSGAAKESRGEI